MRELVFVGSKLPAGSGPRHLSIHPGGDWVYVVNEYANTLTHLHLDRGVLTAGHSVSTLPPSFEGSNSAAANLISGDGRFVYVSNRGHDSIAIFALEPKGQPVLLGHASAGGVEPTHLAFCRGGKGVLAANPGGGSVSGLDRDPVSGALGEPSQVIAVVSPTCVVCP